MGGDSPKREEVEKSGDIIFPTSAPEKDERKKFNDPGVHMTPLTDLPSNQRELELKDDMKELASSSGSEQVQETALFSPGFSSVAARAGWDAEALLMAALSRSPMESESTDPITQVDARKRDKHTPLSSARRHRRIRLEDKNGIPLGRLPMQPLTPISDSELENITPANESSGPVLAAEGKENCNHSSLTCKRENELTGKEKDRTPSKPFCMDQLREELSCAVCLDICFEPSTISCGHSFCGTCLQSVLQKCGPRCPKCRQPLRSEALRSCRTNTVLWNTIQILFPKESAARMQDKNKSIAKEAADRASTEENRSGRYLGTRPSRMQPWRGSVFTNVRRTNVAENLRTSFQAASELIMPSSLARDDTSEQYDLQTRIGREHGESVGGSLSTTRQTEAQATQEQVDAALAARLQQAELNASSDVEDVLVIQEPGGGSRMSRDATALRRTAGTVAIAAVNLRTIAQRAPRQRRGARIRS